MSKKQDPEDRFYAKIIELPNGCWQWIGAKDKEKGKGYGQFNAGKGKTVLAHRFAWELEHGPIPKDRELDHLCRNPGCVNPNHMELVSHKENVERGARPGRPWEPPELEPGR